MGSLSQKLTFDPSIIDQSQIDTIDKIVSDIVKNLYSLVDDEKINSTKLMILCSIIGKHKRKHNDIECETDHVTTYLPSKEMTNNLCEKKNPILTQPKSALHSIIEESLNEALFGLVGNKTLEIYTVHSISGANGEHKLMRIPIVFIDSPKTQHILNFLNMLQSFSANNESLDIIIGSDHLKQVISGSVLKDYSWKRSYVQQRMDDFVRMYGNTTDKLIPRVTGLKCVTFDSRFIEIKINGVYDEIIKIYGGIYGYVNINFVRKNTNYKINEKTYESDLDGVLSLKLELFR